MLMPNKKGNPKSYSIFMASSICLTAFLIYCWSTDETVLDDLMTEALYCFERILNKAIPVCSGS